MTHGRRNQFRVTPDDAKCFLWSQFELSSAGTGRLVLVSGGVASGKTTLQYDLLDDAAGAGALTLSAVGAPDEQDIEGAVIDQLVNNLPASVALPDAVRAMRPPITRDGTDAVGAERSVQFVRTVCDALLNLARERPMVIGVDDLHFVDETSLKLLLQLQRRVRATRLLIVLNQQDWRQASRPRLDTYFSRLPGFCSVQLAPLSVRTIETMLGDSPEGAAAGELATRVHALSAGNPMLADALVDDLREGGGDGEPVVGPAYAQAVHTLLDRPDLTLLDVAAGVAVLGGGADAGGVGLLAKLVGIDPEAVADVLDALAAGGLLVEGRFRHPAAEAVVLNSLPPVTRARLHRRAAKLKHRRAAGATEVAGHLVAAGEASADWAVPVLRRAAEQAMVADDVGFAGQCLELALSVSTDAAEQRAIRRSFVGSTWRVNPSAVAPYVLSLRDTALDGPNGPDLDPADCFALIRHSLWYGDRDTFARAHQVLLDSPEPFDPQAEAELRLAHQWHFGPAPAASREADVHPAAAPWSQAVDTLLGAPERGWTEVTNASAERILQNCRLGDTALEALLTAIVALVRGGRGDRAERWCARLSAEAQQRGAVTWRAVLDALLAAILLRRGEIACAAQRARGSLDLLGDANWGVFIALPLTTLLHAHLAAGAYDDAARTLRRPVPEAMFDTVGGLWYLRACGHFYLATNRPLAAVSDFQRAKRLMARWDERTPTLTPWRSDLAEATLALGNLAMARDLARRQVELSIDTDQYACGLALRVLAFASAPAEGSMLLEQAAECFQKVGDRLELDRTRAAAAQLQSPRVFGPSRVPEIKRIPVRVATKDFAQEFAVAPASAKAGTPGPALGAPARRGPAEAGDPADSAVLSEAELRVAQLAALGHTNRQIGSRLFITVSTVEQHLTRAYRKLGIRGRGALAAELRVREPAGEPAE